MLRLSSMLRLDDCMSEKREREKKRKKKLRHFVGRKQKHQIQKITHVVVTHFSLIAKNKYFKQNIKKKNDVIFTSVAV